MPPIPATTTIITDCRDANAQSRVAARAAALLGTPATFVGVASDIEAAGNIIDSIDALAGAPGVVLANVAPRNGTAKQWPNGTPFGYFYYHDTLVIASIDGATLALVAQLQLSDTINVFDIPTVMQALVAAGSLDAQTAARITATQFRSFEFLPRAAAWLCQGFTLPSQPTALHDSEPLPPTVWWVDNFGNCKTTLVANNLTDTQKKYLQEQYGCTYYDRLKDVPDGERALVAGSSGLDGQRFLEIVVQGGNAAQALGLHSGSIL